MMLEVQISTYGASGLMRVASMELPSLSDVMFTICLQAPESEQINIPENLQRKDIRILRHDSKGLSINRNFGIDNAVGEIVLLADDDLNYTPEGLKTVLKTFQADSALDFATFRHRGGDNKKFPPESFEFSISKREPSGYYLTSFELAFRRDSLPESIRFSPLLGIGAPFFGSGEENVFLRRMVHSGLNGRYIPEEIVSHLSLTTGSRYPSPAVLRAQGAWFWIRYGFFEGFLRLLRDSPRRHTYYFRAARFMISGFFASRRLFCRDGSERS